MNKPSHKLTERNALVALIPDDEIQNIDVNCPHCGWRTILHCARTKDNQVAVVGEGICGHAREWLVTAGEQHSPHLEFTENCGYASVHTLPPMNQD